MRINRFQQIAYRNLFLWSTQPDFTLVHLEFSFFVHSPIFCTGSFESDLFCLSNHGYIVSFEDIIKGCCKWYTNKRQWRWQQTRCRTLKHQKCRRGLLVVVRVQLELLDHECNWIFFLINILHDNKGKQNEHHLWEHGVIMNKETTLFVFIKSKGQDSTY